MKKIFLVAFYFLNIFLFVKCDECFLANESNGDLARYRVLNNSDCNIFKIAHSEIKCTYTFDIEQAKRIYFERLRLIVDSFWGIRKCLNSSHLYYCIFEKLYGARILLCDNCSLKCLLEYFYNEIRRVIECESKPCGWAESMPPIPQFEDSKKINSIIDCFDVQLKKISMSENEKQLWKRIFSEIFVLTNNYKNDLYEHYSNNWELYY
jgi:hypothetical protein